MESALPCRHETPPPPTPRLDPWHQNVLLNHLISEDRKEREGGQAHNGW